ncbi:MAG: exopolysaccharide biosynthesis protein [Rhodovibrionaceae bacterium]
MSFETRGEPTPGPQDTRARERLPTSAILEGIARDAPPEGVTLKWIVANLRDRSFGIVMLMIGLVGLLPGISPLVGILLAIPAVQMILGRSEPVLPRRLAERRLSAARLARLLARVIPTMRRLERVVRPRHNRAFGLAKRIVGGIILLLGATLLTPIPFSQVIPSLVIVLLAFAVLEEDGLLLALAGLAALLSIAITAAALWGTVEAGLSF